MIGRDFLYVIYLCWSCVELCKPLTGSTSELFRHIALHKKVLYAGGDDGTVTEMVIKGDHALLTTSHNIGSAITSLSFNPSHHKLAISCSVVSYNCLVYCEHLL